MGGLVLAWVRNEKMMMGGSNHKSLPACYYSRLSVSNVLHGQTVRDDGHL